MAELEHHVFEGTAEVCGRATGMAGLRVTYCGLSMAHPVHTGVCTHCTYRLEPRKGDGMEVCRFCKVHYVSCLSCQRSALHGA